MADEELLGFLKMGVDYWNDMRKSPQMMYTGDPNLSDLEVPADWYPDLSGCKLQGADLENANLERTNLAHADLESANLADANLWQTYLVEANLANADLRGADLEGANLVGSILTGADLRGANLTSARLNRTGLGYVNAENAILVNADLTNAYLVHANLRGADLSGAELTAEKTGESGIWGGFLDLATCFGIETAVFSEEDYLSRYLERAFDYAHRVDTRDAMLWSDFVAATLKKIKALRALYPDSAPPLALVEALQTITAELIKYLAKHPEALYNIKPRRFEELIAEILASYGWQVELTPYSKDGGYDIFAISPLRSEVTTSWIIECKRYAKERKVGVDIARALYGVKGDLKVANAMLATTSYFTKGVHDLKASRYDLELKDYEGILEWLNEYRPNPDGRLYIKDNRLVLPGDE